jgi:hypothetical protein
MVLLAVAVAIVSVGARGRPNRARSVGFSTSEIDGIFVGITVLISA